MDSSHNLIALFEQRCKDTENGKQARIEDEERKRQEKFRQNLDYVCTIAIVT
jgi:hypothetical protein